MPVWPHFTPNESKTTAQNSNKILIENRKKKTAYQNFCNAYIRKPLKLAQGFQRHSSIKLAKQLQSVTLTTKTGKRSAECERNLFLKVAPNMSKKNPKQLHKKVLRGDN